MLGVTGPATAQPSYEESMARQRAQEQSIQQDNWMAGEAAAQRAAEEDSYQEQNRSYDPPPPQFAESHMAVIWHYDTSAIWATSGHRTGESAKDAALAACKQIMGDGCLVGAHWLNNSYIAVVHDETGVPWIKGGAKSRGVAEAEAMKLCRQHSFGCKTSQVFGETPIPVNAPAAMDLSSNHFPQGAIPRHQFALVAWPEQQPPAAWLGKTWFASGQSNWLVAQKQIVDRCRADANIACRIGHAITNGVLVRYVDEKGQIFWIGAGSASTAADRVKALCAKGSQCRVVETFDARTPRAQVVDDTKAQMPLRGFFAIGWPSVASKWGKVAIVTGRASNAEAKAAAVALCEKQSGVRCEPFLDEDDHGTQQFLGLYQESSGSIRVTFGYSSNGVEQRATESCARAKVTCTQKAMLDLAKAVSITPAL